MQKIKNAETLAGVHTHPHTHTGNLLTEKNKLKKATQNNLKNVNFDRLLCVAF